MCPAGEQDGLALYQPCHLPLSVTSVSECQGLLSPYSDQVSLYKNWF